MTKTLITPKESLQKGSTVAEQYTIIEELGWGGLGVVYGELYTALEQHVIDGAEAANTNYFSKKFYEPAPYWAQVGWIHLFEYVIMSRYFKSGCLSITESSSMTQLR